MKIASFVRAAGMPQSLPVLFGIAAGITLTMLPAGAGAQETSVLQPVLLANATLPDSPEMVRETESNLATSTSASEGARVDFGAPTAATLPMASTSDKYIAPGQPVPALTARNKFALGVKDAISPLSAVGWVISAGYAQALNGSPNYGTNASAFAQRFGAAAARATSEGIFSDSIMDSVLHEDPRYYRMGPGHNFIQRIVYAGTRAIVTRTDSGHSSPNFALLAGNLGGSYLTKAYYPPLNTSNVEVFKTFGGSIGGSALGFVVSEFLPGGLNPFHSSKRTTAP